MKIITVWSRDGDFNHIEDGYNVERKEPTPMSEEQRKSWKGSTWNAVRAILSDDGKVLPIVYYDIDDYEITVDTNENNPTT